MPRSRAAASRPARLDPGPRPARARRRQRCRESRRSRGSNDVAIRGARARVGLHARSRSCSRWQSSRSSRRSCGARSARRRRTSVPSRRRRSACTPCASRCMRMSREIEMAYIANESQRARVHAHVPQVVVAGGRRRALVLVVRAPAPARGARRGRHVGHHLFRRARSRQPAHHEPHARARRDGCSPRIRRRSRARPTSCAPTS